MSATEQTIQWQGMAVLIRHVPDWSGTGFDHLEIRTADPERAPLPITDTGYRSHFLPSAELAAYGGPLAFVAAWLDHEANSDQWKAQAANSKQLSLF